MSQPLKILVSAGPTVEKIDPVRFISNRSSGKMGYAIAEAARKSGYEVTLVSGPVNITPPDGVNLIKIESAAQMAEAVKKNAPQMDCIIMAAAVADYRPSRFAAQKIKKNSDSLTIELERTEDILLALGRQKSSGQILVGFAAETENLIANAAEKIRKKNLDFIVANDVSLSDRGFNSENNAVVILNRSGEKIEIPLMSKLQIAEEILKTVLNHA